MRRCILHVGSPKTGTTSIQHVLKRDRRRFLKHGILVPESGQASSGAHRALAFKLAGLPVEPKDDGAEHSFVRELSVSDAETVLISSEFLQRILCTPGQGERLIGKLRSLGLEVTILIYVRNQAQFLNSSYVQAVTHFRRAEEFAVFARRALRGSSKYSYSQWVEFSAEHRVPILARPFSATTRSSGVVEDFLDTVGIASAAGFETRVALNRSAGPFLVAVARSLLCRIGGPSRLAKQQSKRCREAFASELQAIQLDEPAYCGLTTELAREIEQAFSADNESFARFAWGRRWDEVFASDVGRRFEPNDYSLVGIPAERRQLFGSVLARLEQEIDKALEPWKSRRPTEPQTRPCAPGAVS